MYTAKTKLGAGIFGSKEDGQSEYTFAMIGPALLHRNENFKLTETMHR